MPEATVEDILGVIHDRDYLGFLHTASREATSTHPVFAPEWAAPEVAADTPVCAGSANAARSAVEAALTAARLLHSGAAATYALCRPPGHHAGRRWMGGYCYLNNAAAAVAYLRRETRATIGVLDIDFHMANGTASITADMEGVWLESIHGSTLKNFPWLPDFFRRRPSVVPAGFLESEAPPAPAEEVE